MSARRPTFDAPMVISKTWKNWWRRAVIVISLNHFEGNNLVDIREHCTGADGIDRPTAKGLAVGIGKLPELVRALVKAVAAARELGLLPPDDGGGA
jgi:hypothetical protein